MSILLKFQSLLRVLPEGIIDGETEDLTGVRDEFDGAISIMSTYREQLGNDNTISKNKFVC